MYGCVYGCETLPLFCVLILFSVGSIVLDVCECEVSAEFHAVGWAVLESIMETLQKFYRSRYATVDSDSSDERQAIHPQSQE